MAARRVTFDWKAKNGQGWRRWSFLSYPPFTRARAVNLDPMARQPWRGRNVGYDKKLHLLHPCGYARGHERQTFIITLRGPAGVEAIRALRGLLKIDSRRYGLACVAVPELPRDPIEPEPSAQHDVEDIHAHTTEHGQNAQPRGASAVTRARRTRPQSCQSGDRESSNPTTSVQSGTRTRLPQAVASEADGPILDVLADLESSESPAPADRVS